MPSFHVLAQAPSVSPKDPPGFDKIQTVIDWLGKLSLTACVIGVLVTGATLAVQHQRGTLSPETGGRLGVVLMACVLIGVASQLVSALV